MARTTLPFQQQVVVDSNRVSKVSVFAHMPQLVLGEDAPFDLGFGRLSPLAFDDWLQLEIPGAAYLDNAYKRANPSFLIMERSVEELPKIENAGERDASALLRYIEPLYSALVMTVGPLLSPSFSSTYVWLDPAGECLRFFGPLERDMLTTPPAEPRTLNLADVPALRHRIDRLQLLFDLDEPETVLRAIDGIRLLEDSQTSLIDAVAQTVQVHEDIVNPDGVMSRLATDFGSRLALILSKEFHDFDRWQNISKQLYTIRNHIIHGDPVIEHFATLEELAGVPTLAIIWNVSMRMASVLGALVAQHRTGEKADAVLQSIFTASFPLTEERFLTARQALRLDWFV